MVGRTGRCTPRIFDRDCADLYPYLRYSEETRSRSCPLDYRQFGVELVLDANAYLINGHRLEQFAYKVQETKISSGATTHSKRDWQFLPGSMPAPQPAPAPVPEPAPDPGDEAAPDPDIPLPGFRSCARVKVPEYGV